MKLKIVSTILAKHLIQLSTFESCALLLSLKSRQRKSLKSIQRHKKGGKEGARAKERTSERKRERERERERERREKRDWQRKRN